MNIAEFKTDELLTELLKRPDLVAEDGSLTALPWQTRVRLGAIACVDSIAVRTGTGGHKEALAIMRNTGPYAGKYCVIGGSIRRGESIEDAVRRHWMVDIGCEINFITPWNKPRSVHQHCPPAPNGGMKKDFWPEPTKYSIGLFHIVEVTKETGKLGSTATGGQEASGYTWFTAETLPQADQFAYGFHALYKEIFSE